MALRRDVVWHGKTTPGQWASAAAAFAITAGLAHAQTANPNAPAVIAVSNKVIRPKSKVMPLGANNFGGIGAVDYIANNFVNNSGNEPMSIRRLYRVAKSYGNAAELDRGGASNYDLYRSGYLSGSSVRVYRLVDKNGKSLPQVGDDPNNTYLDLDKAAAVKLVRTGRVVPEGAAGFPDGGWVANKFSNVRSLEALRYNLKHTDFLFQKPGRSYYYVVTAVDANGNESDYSNEVAATPRPSGNASPRIVVTSNEEATIRRGIKANEGLGNWGGNFTIRALGGTSPFKWEVLDRTNKPFQFPEGMKLNTNQTDSSRYNFSLAVLEGGFKEEPKNVFLRFKVTDATGKFDTRDYVVNPADDTKDANDKTKPAPPQSVTVTANQNSVTLHWKPSSSADVVGYKVYRSEVTKDKQEERVYLEGNGAPLEKDDYLFFDRIMTGVNPSYTSPRVGFEPGLVGFYGWHWSPSNGTLLEMVPHQKPLPASFNDGGETCLQVKATEGENSLVQNVFTGANGTANTWYGQLEPGKKYRLEVWLRQEGLANNGQVVFDYSGGGPGYAAITKTFNVSGTWKKFTYDFTGPALPDKENIFGHRFRFTGAKNSGNGRGLLWMDNCRIFRYDTEADLNKAFAPNRTIVNEITSSLPKGAKGSWRVYGALMNQATMDSLLSYQANSRYSIDWMTSVDSQTNITLPMALEALLQTGKTPATRVHPFLTMQVYFTEKEWQNFIEYMAAPYDPKTDSPTKKPYAYLRYKQRGVATPWTDEFPHITIELGNETWHNGTFAGWEGFGRSYVSWAPNEGREMGLFSNYYFQNMTKSPYWKSRNLSQKISFNLGGFYNGNVETDGTVTGYAENARKLSPLMAQIGHATYVGPKWETGDAPLTSFNDEGVLETLVSYVANSQELWTQQSAAMKKMTQMGMPYDLTAYEGGPSGYYLPGQGEPAAVAATEKYGKSLAMAVAAMDGWLDATRLGWTYQNFLGFGQGEYWASHTTFANGFRPSPGWLALKLRNQFGVGEMIASSVKGPAFDRTRSGKTAAVPLIGSYAFRDGNKYGVFVLSRKIDGKVEGVDFGNGYTRTALKLPFTNPKKITLYKLTGNPRASNVDALNIKIQTQSINVTNFNNNTRVLPVNRATGGGTGGMPPGSIFLYIFEGATPGK